jgi:pyruvate dehydrogenase complex dehydrogenase (E1) component
MEECVDGDYQAFKAKGGAYLRKNSLASILSCWKWSAT